MSEIEIWLMAGIDQDNAEGEIDHMLPPRESPCCKTVQDYKTSRAFHYHRCNHFFHNRL